MKKFNKKDLVTIPNLMVYFRILLIPLFCWLYLRADTQVEYLYATIVVLVSSLTDLFDGMIARKFNQVTEFGKILDPVADKLTHAALAVCLAIKHPIVWALIGLMAVKEGYMAIMGAYFLKKGKMIDGAMWYGKVCTASLFVVLLVLFLFPNLPDLAIYIMVGVLMAIMLYTLVRYIILYTKMLKELKNEKKEVETEE